ncbi:MAG: lytic murein transglycosylase [Deltaproteobacteria bacterium]|jgi:membrane-bound lytic murein transglycosylase B|nr:lytic murein transglycosylase [Deltaproteobacteria bacterium]
MAYTLRKNILILTVILTTFFISDGQSAYAEDFSSWLEDFRQEARTKGISEATLHAALDDLQPIPRVIELDRKQPEFTQTFWRYLDARVTEDRVERGRMLRELHTELLDSIAREYGVQPRFLVAFWGLETNFGDYLGSFPVIGSLATLAHDPRRSDFFRTELLAALSIIDAGHIPVSEMVGSWAGAMGQPQFMPSTFVRFAVDGDGDGRRDIWHSLPDVFASAANFLSKSGWQGERNWGREVKLPPDFALELAGLEVEKSLVAWQVLGVRKINGDELPRVNIKASVVLPAGHAGPAFLVYNNFRTTLQWNRSDLYAIAVGHLADRIAGKEALATARPVSEQRLSRNQVEKIQELLTAQGFDPGPIDGVVGSQTRQAIKEFQRMAKLPADGHPTPELLEELGKNE